MFGERYFDKNFYLLRITDEESFSGIPAIYLILNLVTRKQSLIEEEELHEKVFKYVNDQLADDEEPYQLEAWMVEDSEISEMKVESNQIEIKHYMMMTHDGYHGEDDNLIIG